ncbi:unnamed protein product [Sphenostylis stenocarpa]|uniref:Wax synthase domain-containing protein n=1 Tax=Sphenostylis stenocarpa TaxID=92480 RepID=A0AA86VKS1_9FABA|nr:unnamed protein product [Sphenostylis stenocarpa]
MDGEIERLIKVWISAIIGLCYCYYLASRIPKGLLRLLSFLPLLFLFLILPLNLSSPTLIGITSFFLVLLGTSKLLLYSFNQGPLALSPPYIVHFISIAFLPIIPKQHPPTNENHKPKWLVPLKVLIFAMIIRVYDFKENLHPNFMLVIYCCHVYLSLELLLIFISVTIRTLFGFEIEPHFNEPYISTSLQDFWGHRWNLMVTLILRPTVYNPIRRMFKSFVGSSCASSAAMLATFLVSGLMHELIYYYLVAGHRGWQLHRLVSGLLVVSFLAITANWLFFPQLLRNGVDTKATEEYASLVEFAKSKFSKQHNYSVLHV